MLIVVGCKSGSGGGPMLLEGRVAVVYGAGAIGGAVARGFAREGARVFIASRAKATADALAADILAAGGQADSAELDALDETAVAAFIDGVVARAGRIDISFNLIGYADAQRPLDEIAVEDFLQPIATAMRPHFLTERAAVRQMRRQGGGVLLAFGDGGIQTSPGLGGFKIALDAVESLRRQWSLEHGEDGIRFVTLKTGGIPETIPEGMPGREEIVASFRDAALLDRLATLDDVGRVANWSQRGGVGVDRRRQLLKQSLPVVTLRGWRGPPKGRRRRGQRRAGVPGTGRRSSSSSPNCTHHGCVRGWWSAPRWSNGC
jgi:3-oxoacyl-[acyl-carrier protein] reductase